VNTSQWKKIISESGAFDSITFIVFSTGKKLTWNKWNAENPRMTGGRDSTWQSKKSYPVTYAQIPKRINL